MCGRTAVAEISACLRSRLSSCITVSARGFAGVQQLTFKLYEVDRSTKGSVPSSCPDICGEGVWEVLLPWDMGSFLLPPGTSLLLRGSSLSMQR